MRIAVLGATSRTGLQLLAQARQRGHQIVAFTRRPGALPDSPALAAVVRGDGRDPGALTGALAGADAAISLLPGGGRADPHLASAAARALITAMPRAGVHRLVVVSAYPIAGDRHRLPVWVLRRVLATPYADVAQMEQIVMASDLNWAIARLNRLTSKPATGAITISTGLLARPRPHTRADTAAVLLDLAERPAPARTAVNLTGAQLPGGSRGNDNACHRIGGLRRRRHDRLPPARPRARHHRGTRLHVLGVQPAATRPGPG